MCSRVTLAQDIPAIAEAFPGVTLPGDIPKRYNVAPTDVLYAVVVTGSGERKLVRLAWGLVPSWSKDPSIGHKLINARAETISRKPSFSKPFSERRCLIVVDGFYEWKPSPDGKTRIPYRFTVEGGGPYALAGIWDRWLGEGEGEELRTCAVITTAANPLVAEVHDRMPAIIPPDGYDRWLDPSLHDADSLKGMLVPYPAERMRMAAVSHRVNNPRNEGPELVEPE